jgi:hypothetical protein
MDSDASNSVGLKLADIGNYENMNDFSTIGLSGLFTGLLMILSARVGGFGGLPLNTFFDMFGIEGVITIVTFIVVLFQITRYLYTAFYEKSGKTWSPFVFICFLLGAHLIHDLVFYYGIVSQLPKGKNDMIDILRALAANHKVYTLVAHSAILVATALIAMILHEVSDLAKLIVFVVMLYITPYALAIHYPKPAPPPPPPKKEKMEDMRGNYY